MRSEGEEPKVAQEPSEPEAMEVEIPSAPTPEAEIVSEPEPIEEYVEDRNCMI